jgi:hypothetical protein
MEIGNALTEEILFGRLKNGGSVQVGLKNKKLTFAYQERKGHSRSARVKSRAVSGG